MTDAPLAPSVRRILAVASALVLVLTLAACGKTGGGTTAAPTAKGGLEAARATLSTTAPDAKLLVVQTAEPVTPTSTPIWGYLFGSEKTGAVYAVYVDKGKATPPQQFGTAGLKPDEWKAIPGIDAWKIDSDEAYKKALAAAGGKAGVPPEAYAMGFVTYVPKSAASSVTVTPMRWNVNFQPGKSGVTTKTIEVDVRTGATTVKK